MKKMIFGTTIVLSLFVAMPVQADQKPVLVTTLAAQENNTFVVNNKQIAKDAVLTLPKQVNKTTTILSKDADGNQIAKKIVRTRAIGLSKESNETLMTMTALLEEDQEIFLYQVKGSHMIYAAVIK